jgi:ABC-type phosphate/phosphonate transport system permease subunit
MDFLEIINRIYFLDKWRDVIYTFYKFEGTMKTLMKLLETVYAIMYFLIAIVAAIILYPLSFLFSKVHHEESGYDL